MKYAISCETETFQSVTVVAVVPFKEGQTEENFVDVLKINMFIKLRAFTHLILYLVLVV